MSRQEASVSEGGESAETEDDSRVEPVTPPVPRPLPPFTAKTRRNVERLNQVRWEIESFETCNKYQAELRTVLFVIVDHMRREHCMAGEEKGFERWWSVLEIYRRVLLSPEMAGVSARTVLPKILALEHGDLTERRVAYALGRRKARKRRKRKRLLSKRQQRFRKIEKAVAGWQRSRR